eukprot:6191017-Pleurochrysis_carterae.AAC.3
MFAWSFLPTFLAAAAAYGTPQSNRYPAFESWKMTYSSMSSSTAPSSCGSDTYAPLRALQNAYIAAASAQPDSWRQSKIKDFAVIGSCSLDIGCAGTVCAHPRDRGLAATLVIVSS